jgi:hypothetical protein
MWGLFPAHHWANSLTYCLNEGLALGQGGSGKPFLRFWTFHNLGSSLQGWQCPGLAHVFGVFYLWVLQELLGQGCQVSAPARGDGPCTLSQHGVWHHLWPLARDLQSSCCIIAERSEDKTQSSCSLQGRRESRNAICGLFAEPNNKTPPKCLLLVIPIGGHFFFRLFFWDRVLLCSPV